LITRRHPETLGERSRDQRSKAEQGLFEIRRAAVTIEHRPNLGVQQKVDAEQSHTVLEFEQQHALLHHRHDQCVAGQGSQGAEGLFGKSARPRDLEPGGARHLLNSLGKGSDRGSAGGDGRDHGGDTGRDPDHRDDHSPRASCDRTEEQRAKDHPPRPPTSADDPAVIELEDAIGDRRHLGIVGRQQQRRLLVSTQFVE
jgi:hypothetical protein